MPKGRSSLAPKADVGSMSTRLLGSKYGTMPMTKARSPTSATAAMTNMSLSTWPTP